MLQLRAENLKGRDRKTLIQSSGNWTSSFNLDKSRQQSLTFDTWSQGIALTHIDVFGV